MGLITGLLLLPITAPARGFGFLLEQLREEADSVLNDEGRAFAELIDASMRHSAGDLSEADFAVVEAALLDRLNAIRERREGAPDAEWDVGDDALDVEVEEEQDDDALDVDSDAEPGRDPLGADDADVEGER